MARCDCKQDCARFFDHPEVVLARNKLRECNYDEQQQFLTQHLLALKAKGGWKRTDAEAGVERPRTQWHVGEDYVCFKGLALCLGVGRERLRQINKAINENRVAPVDNRHHNEGRDSNVTMNVNAFFEWTYQNLAEPLAECEVSSEMLGPVPPLPPPLTEDLDHRDSDSPDDTATMEELSPLITADQFKQPRYLAPGSLAELYDAYISHVSDTTPTEENASSSTFRRVYKHWKKVLKFRQWSQHAKCSECCRMQKMRREAVNAREREAVQKQLDGHLQIVFADRSIDARMSRLSVATAQGNIATEGILYLVIDGMDQAKFRCPRMVDLNCKELEGCWRPVLHMTGVLAEGWGEFFYIGEADAKKDSNTNLQCLSLTLDKIEAACEEKKQRMPEHLVSLADNTAREGNTRLP